MDIYTTLIGHVKIKRKIDSIKKIERNFEQDEDNYY